MVGAIVSIFLPLSLVAAQTQITAVAGGQPQAQLPDTSNCFDFYHFGSVQARLNTPVAGAVSGTPITFVGTLTNDNPYPIADGALYIKVFKRRVQNDHNGPDVVDQMLVKDHIAIPAKGSAPVSFSWNVPSNAESGDYQLATFFNVSHKFNLLGLPFTDDVVGNSVPFSVTGEQSTGVSFDRAGASINGTAYYFAAFPPQLAANDTATIIAKIKNTTKQTETANVSWVVAHWDSAASENIIEQKTASVTVPAGGSAPVSITVSDTKYPVYFVTATLTWKDTKSIIGIRFLRASIETARINFSGITSFPLKAGKETTMFSCLHDMGAGAVSNARLDVSIDDPSGRTIHSQSYVGAVPATMIGVEEAFTPTSSYDSFTLTAKLYQGDTVVDEVRIPYNCQDIDPAQCLPKSSFIQTIIQAIAVLLGLYALYWVYRRFFHRRPRPQAPKSS